MSMFNKILQKIKGDNQPTKRLNILKTNIPNKNSEEMNFSLKNLRNSFQENYRTSKIVKAYQNSNNEKINKLLQKGKYFYKSIKFPENNNFSLLHQSISDNNIDVINLITSQKYSDEQDIINDKDNDLGLAPLHLTCIYNEPEILDLLLSTGKTSVDEKTDIDGLKPLHICASSGSLKSLVFLAENYYSDKSEDSEENLEIEKDVNRIEKDINKFDNENFNFNKRRIGSKISISKITNKEKKQNSLDIFNDEKWTPLHYACFQNKLDTVNYLIEQGCDLYLQNEQKLSPLALCVLQDNFELFEILYNFNFKEANKEINSEGELQVSVSEQANLIHIASISKKGTRCLDYLLKDPNNVNMICSNDLQATPLHFACMKDNIKAVKSLLRFNANVNVSDYLGNTPLFYATENGNLEILKLLHENGADGVKKNFNGINCFQIAMNQENREVRLFYLSQTQYRYLEDKDKLF